MSSIYHPHKLKKYPERCFSDLPQTVTQKPEVSDHENIELNFQGGQPDKKLKLIFPIKKKLFDKNIACQQKNIIEHSRFETAN